ncbi:MAG: translation initiation factor Sui1 [Proteobacteria bacterium]|nr:translation initiation factor Sui1 [Pseudomonadota bacterium]
MATMKPMKTTVYSTDHGRICPECDKPVASCICRQKKVVVPAKSGVRVGRETKGRKGKGVTVISGLPLDAAALEALAKELKKRCGSGGTVKEGVIEIQGDHRDVLLEDLVKRGWPAKKSGG